MTGKAFAKYTIRMLNNQQGYKLGSFSLMTDEYGLGNTNSLQLQFIET